MIKCITLIDFSDDTTTLHSWDKSYLVMVYNPFNMMLDSVCLNFVEDSCIDIRMRYWFVVFFFVMSACGFSIRVVLASQNVLESVPSYVTFWEEFVKDWC